MRQQFTEHRASPRVDRHVEMHIQAVFGMVGSLAGQGDPLDVRAHRLDLDVRQARVFLVHSYPPTSQRDTPPRRAVKETRARLDFALEVLVDRWGDVELRNTGRRKPWA